MENEQIKFKNISFLYKLEKLRNSIPTSITDIAMIRCYNDEITNKFCDTLYEKCNVNCKNIGIKVILIIIIRKFWK